MSDTVRRLLSDIRKNMTPRDLDALRVRTVCPEHGYVCIVNPEPCPVVLKMLKDKENERISQNRDSV